MFLQKSIIIKTHYNGTPTKVVKLSLLNDANQINILIMNFENPIISSNMVQNKHFKGLSYTPWEELSNVMSLIPYEMTCSIKPLKKLRFSKDYCRHFNKTLE
jgi:hypothetical protein